MTDLIKVRFLRTCLPYFAGDEAGFGQDYVDKLLAFGAAEVVEVVGAVSEPPTPPTAPTPPAVVTTPAQPATGTTAATPTPTDAAALAAQLGLSSPQ